jgi:hypothetical protein
VDCVTILLRILCVLLHLFLFWLFVTTVYLLLSLTCLTIRLSVALSPSACSYVVHWLRYKTASFIPHSVIKCRFPNESPERVERYNSIVSLNSAPHPRERNPVPFVQETGWASEPVWKGAGFHSRAVQPVKNRYNNCGIPAHCSCDYIRIIGLSIVSLLELNDRLSPNQLCQPITTYPVWVTVAAKWRGLFCLDVGVDSD